MQYLRIAPDFAHFDPRPSTVVRGPQMNGAGPGGPSHGYPAKRWFGVEKSIHACDGISAASPGSRRSGLKPSACLTRLRKPCAYRHSSCSSLFPSSGCGGCLRGRPTCCRHRGRRGCGATSQARNPSMTVCKPGCRRSTGMRSRPAFLRRMRPGCVDRLRRLARGDRS